MQPQSEGCGRGQGLTEGRGCSPRVRSVVMARPYQREGMQPQGGERSIVRPCQGRVDAAVGHQHQTEGAATSAQQTLGDIVTLLIFLP